MFVLLLALVACICRADLKLEQLKGKFKENKIKFLLTGLQSDPDAPQGSKQITTSSYSFSQHTNSPMVLLTKNGFKRCIFVEKDVDTQQLVFKYPGDEGVKKIKMSIAGFLQMVRNFQIFIPVRGDKEVTVDIKADSPNKIIIGGLLSPWDERTFVAFDFMARGMFLITGSGEAPKVNSAIFGEQPFIPANHQIVHTKMYEFFGIDNPDKDGQGNLVFLEAGTHDSKRERGTDFDSINPKIFGKAQFVEMIRAGRVAVPMQNVRKRDYFVEYVEAVGIVNRRFNPSLHINVEAVRIANIASRAKANLIRAKSSNARAREDADYYRYGGYAYDGERDYAYDYYEDEEEDDEEYNAYGQGFEAGYRAALEIVMNK